MIANHGVIDWEITPKADVLLETLMLGLRLADGVSLAALTEEFGKEKIQELHQCLQPYFTQGWVQVVGDRLRLSDPDGFLFSNVVLADLFSQLG